MLGIQSGMVMQRGDTNECEIFLESASPVEEVLFAGSLSGRAGVAACGENRFRVTGIPVGGPYTVTVDGQAFSNIYVGDVWMLAGQSNMEGVGRFTDADHALPQDESVRAFYMDDTWGPAKHPMHMLWTAVDKVHNTLHLFEKPAEILTGVGPGLAFARRMKEYTGVPQGVLCCAHGGTSMAQWSPALRHLGGDGSLYGAMLRRFRTSGSHIRGMFWYQGCSDALDCAQAQFAENTLQFFAACREDFGGETPIVQVQISRVVTVPLEPQSENWSIVREAQRVLSERIPRLYTVASITRRLDDMIHLDSDSQRGLGLEAAEAMYHLLHGSDSRGCLPPPAYDGHRILRDEINGSAIAEVFYKNLHGSLISGGRPNGFLVAHEDKAGQETFVYDTALAGNRVILRLFLTPDTRGDFRLYYGYGLDPFCNITDEAGRSIPCMGPVAL